MAHTYPDNLGPGAYVSTTEILDTRLVDRINLKSTELKDFLVRVATIINDINLLLNDKDTGQYALTEFVNSQLFFPNPTLSSTSAATPLLRNVFRKVINFGALPNAATKTVAHGITVQSNCTFTRFYGCASNPGTAFVAIPNSDIKLTADATNISVQTSIDYSAYTTTYIICEYIKS